MNGSLEGALSGDLGVLVVQQLHHKADLGLSCGIM